MGLPAFLLIVRSNSRKNILIKSKNLDFHTLACLLPSWKGHKPIKSHRPMLLTKTLWGVIFVKCCSPPPFFFSLKFVRETPLANSPGYALRKSKQVIKPLFFTRSLAVSSLHYPLLSVTCKLTKTRNLTSLVCSASPSQPTIKSKDDKEVSSKAV